ncbi:MAG: hypothetical protein QM527_11365 [Alphaproteobacteria bacterium]|nr:hypothetical protein [Alphaproteobacteria bacterium]
MVFFNEYLMALGARRGIVRSTDGNQSTYRISHAGVISLTVVAHELNDVKPDRLMGPDWPEPRESANKVAFMREVLLFNRNALNHLHVGIRQDPENRHLYRLICDVPKIKKQPEQWMEMLLLFSKLAEKSWVVMSKQKMKKVSQASSEEGHQIFMP